MKRLSVRLSCFLLSIAMLLSLLPVSVFAAEAADGSGGAQLQSDVALTIPGYTRVTELPADGLSGKYLIVATYNDNYYMFYPGATGGGQNVKNAAKLEVGADGAATGYKVNVPNYDDAEAKTDFTAAENTIAKRGESNARGELYSATAVGPNGETYSLCKKDTSGGTGAIYQTNCESAFTVHEATDTGYFNLRHQVGTGSYLIFYSNHMNFNQQSSHIATADFMLFQRDPVTIPGYNQVTSADQIDKIADKTKFLVVAEGKTGLYALYPRLSSGVTAGALPTPASTYGLRCAKLAVSGETVTATAAASQGAASLETSISDIASLHLTITPGDGSYTFTSTADNNVKLNMGSSGMFAADASNLTVEITNSELHVANGTARYLSFSESGTTYKFSDGAGTDFWGPNVKQGAPVYLFYNGDLPAADVTPGSALAGMLTGDLIGGANGSTDPAGQNSWVFTGGRAAQGSFADVAGARTWAGHFEEYVRYTNAKQLKPSGEADTPYFQRHVINAAYEGQKLADIVSSFDTRIAALKPRAVVYLVDENGSTETDFATNLGNLITKSLALRGNTGMIVIETLTQADKTAVDAVVDALDAGLKPRVLPVLFTLADEEKTDGYPNAQGHLAMAKQLADAVVGSTVSSSTGWPYGAIAAGTFDANWPNKQTVTADHDGYGTPDTLTTAQQALKDKMTAKADSAMTWLFMGDSITHGAAWTGGYDSLAQLFEKFVKDDLGRKQDIVINAGSSGANTASTISDLDRRLSKYSPDVVVLMLGTNTSGVSDDQYKANIRTILNAIIAKGAVPVLRTPPPSTNSGYTSRLATRSQLIREVAEDAAYAGKVILVDQYELWSNSNYTDVITRDTSLYIHPEESGHLWFAHQLINEMGLWKSDSAICNLEYVARETAVSPENLTIDGYTRVTELPAEGLDAGYYLLVVPYNGDFYMLYPGATGAGETGNNAAKLVVNSITGKATGYIPRGAVAAGSAYGGSAVTDFATADNLVTPSGSTAVYNDNPAYSVTARTGSYALFVGTNVVYSASGDSVAFFIPNNDGTFTARNNADNHGALHFFQNHMNFNQSSGTPANSSFLLFKSETPPPVPLAELEALIATAKSMNQSDYTAASWAALAAPLTAAEAVVADSDQKADYLVVSNALKNLQTAVNGLQQKPQYPQVPSGATVKELDQLKPDPKTGLSQPFPSTNGGIGGETGNDSYRIPGITTVKGGDHDGRLVAATDIRWRDFKDSSNIDTAVSYSDDGGVTWNTSIVNYFGDTANIATANRSAIFIDPLITADNDGSLFLVTNAFPAGTCTHGSRNQPLAQSTGFVNVTLHDGTQVSGQRMAIYTDYVTSTQTDGNYAYYLDEFGADGYADILDAYDGSASGYYADRHFYLYYQKGEAKAPATDKIYCKQIDANNQDSDIYIQQNLFFQNATLHVRTCQFIYLVKSTDGGETWSDPVILNPQLRTDQETFYGPGPGAGICLEDDTLIIPMYDNGGGEHATCIYSTDGGVTWTRGQRLDTGSESCIIPIDATTIRQFYRDNTTTIHYNDRTLQNDGDWKPGGQQSASGAPKQGNNQLSALRYSQKVNGKDIILVSTATSPGTAGGYQRKGGKIYAFELKSDKTMELLSTYEVNKAGDWYGYSSLTELKDGNIGLIYENSQTDGNDSNSPGYCGLTYRTIPMNEIVESEAQTVSLTPTEAQLFTNVAGGATTVQLNAAVTPAGTIEWTSSNTSVATVSNTGLVTAVGDGTAIITAASSSDKTAFATCTVTVATRIESITVKKDGTAIGSEPVKVYTNANDAGHSVTLTAESVPAVVTHPALNWTRPEGAKGQITLSDRGENGRSITITAVPGEKNVGEVTVQVASADHPDTKTRFKVHVIRKLENNVSISIQGVNDPTKAPQCGQTLEADINDLQMTDVGKAALTYQWKRTKGGTTTNIGTGSKTYILTQDDVGATISVDVTAGAGTFYEGVRSASRRQTVEKADGPLTGPQGLIGNAPHDANTNDGSISGFESDFANYEYRLVVTDGVENEWTPVSAATIDNLAAGTYQVRAKETDTHKAGGFSVVTVPAAGATTYAVALGAMTNGRVSRSASVAAENDPVTLTVLPETGYRLAADGLSVETSGGTKVAVTKAAGKDNEYTFTMPGEAVTVKATFAQLEFTITHELTHLRCSRGAADGHQVAYGASTAITLVPEEGYALPLRKDITITNSRGVKITGWTINDEGVIEITGGVTSDLLIVAVGRAATHTVNYTLTNGLSAPEANAPRSVEHLAAYTGTLEPETGFALPETIIVTVGGNLIGAENYLYNKDTGEISISEGKISGDVVITAAGVKTGDDVVPVTGVTLDRDDASVTVGGTVALTATVAPANATTKNVVWSTEDDSIATVDENGNVRGEAEGTTVITVMTLDGRHTASCTVTVSAGQSGDDAAKLSSLTVKNGATDVDLTPAFAAGTTEYAASVENSVESVTVTGTAATGATVTVKKGDTPCTNGEVALDVGENVVTVTVEEDEKTSTTYTITITRAAGTQQPDELTGTVTITGAAKYDETLTATVNVTNTGVNVEDLTLTYVWKRGGTDITGAESETYRLVKEDIGAVITVVVTADGYTGELTAETATVAKADGPAAPVVAAEQCTTDANNDGKITGLDESKSYEYREVTDPETTTWTAVDANSTEITGLEPGTYEVREKVADPEVQQLGAAATAEIHEHGVVVRNITVTLTNATYTGNTAIADGGTATITLIANDGYVLPETITVTMGDDTLVAGTGYTYENGVVTITNVTGNVEITATCTQVTVDKSALTDAIATAEAAKEDIEVMDDGTTEADVDEGTKFVTETGMKALTDAIEAAQTVANNADATQDDVDAAVNALNDAVAAFEDAIKTGTYTQPSIPSVVTPSNPSTTTTVEKNEDGSTTTTVTDKKTGTVTETTEKPDGTKEIVETKKDGTVTETTEKTDGSKEVVETKPDGTVTETKTDAEGAKTEKVTDPGKNVAVTVTDKDGEVQAKVELPSEIPAPETRFEDVPVGHWADEAIHNMAALEVVNGVGNNRFDMNSSMTRGALATVLSRLSNGQEGLESSFADVDADKWYADGIAWAAKTGVVTGYSESNFGPEDVITREQLAVMLCRYARLLGMDTTADSTGLDKFNDGSSTHDWAADSIAWCVNNGILNGMGNGSLAPTATATRAQVAVMLQRFLELLK